MTTTKALALAESFNPFAPAQLANPYPIYQHARDESPAFWSPVLGMWVVSRYQDVSRVLRDHETFSSWDTMRTAPHCQEALDVLKAGGHARPPLTLDNDPPDHTRVRGAITKAFTPGRVAALEPGTCALVDSLIDSFEADGHADLVGQLAFPLPLRVIMDLLGLPAEDMEAIRGWTQASAAFLWAPLTPEQQVDCAHAMVAYLRYCEGHTRSRRATPSDDLLSDLVRGQSDGPASLTDTEISHLINDLLSAGHETTTFALANAVKLLLAHPTQWAALIVDDSLLPGAIEEALRVEGSVMGLPRRATKETQIAGVTIPAGALVYASIASGAHDDGYVPNAERFDIRRSKPEKPLSFGHGVHHCLGATLARMELRVALSAIKRRLPNLRMPEQTLTYKPNLVVRGPERLEIAWDVGENKG